MGLGQLILLEGLLLLSAGITFFGGIRGTVGAVGLLSLINVLTNGIDNFWKWEVILLMASSIGIIILILLDKKAAKSKFTGGLVGGLISLVLFGAFVTPIIAIIMWSLVMGTGFIRKPEKSKAFWSFAPSLWRIILGITWLVYGNVFTS